MTTIDLVRDLTSLPDGYAIRDKDGLLGELHTRPDGTRVVRSVNGRQQDLLDFQRFLPATPQIDAKPILFHEATRTADQVADLLPHIGTILGGSAINDLRRAVGLLRRVATESTVIPADQVALAAQTYATNAYPENSPSMSTITALQRQAAYDAYIAVLSTGLPFDPTAPRGDLLPSLNLPQEVQQRAWDTLARVWLSAPTPGEVLVAVLGAVFALEQDVPTPA